MATLSRHGETTIETCRPRWQGKRALAAVCASAIASLNEPVLAQQEALPELNLGKVEVTGSHIPRSDIETALPVQVITREDIERSGSTTVAEVMAKVSANVLGFNDQLSVGDPVTPGLSSVNLRGLGEGSTLVLLNGRRLANYAFSGSAVDVNSIPLAAIDRIEILKDGASAIYGADAIAGVVNFILRKDFTGAEFTGFGGWTQQGGGDQWQAIATVGTGDLVRDKYNLFVSATYQKDDALNATQRPFARTGYIPDEGIIQLSPATFPANIFVIPPRLFNPSYSSGCTPPSSLPATSARTPGDACGYDSAALASIIPRAERLGAFGRGTLQIAAQHQLFAEASYASNRMTFSIAPTPVAAFSNPNFEPVLYPAGGPYYPAEFAAANGISGDLSLVYRTAPLGNRVSQVDTSAWRAVIGADGDLAGWSYGTALTYSRTEQNQSFTSGYVSLQRILDAMATGLVNPFGASGPEGNALLAGAQVTGESRFAKGTTVEFDLKGSKDVYALPAGSLAIALGAEARREQLDNGFAPFVTSGDLLGINFAQQSVSGGRNAQALFVEASVPIGAGIEAQLALRYDHYSDFGGTTNPKVALRWQPVKALLLRTSWGTGFRAPPLYDLYTPQSGTFVLFQEDPVRCPVTQADQDCVVHPAVVGGNPNLKPETSEQFNAGVVWEPVGGLSLAIDYWKINKSNVINSLDPDTIFSNFSYYAPTNIIRGPVDPAYPDLPGPIDLVLLTQQNLGGVRTSGIDVDVRWRGRATAIGRWGFSLNGTYLIEWEAQPDGLNYVSSVGRNSINSNGPFPRWKHYASLSWDYGPWGATLAQTYQSGYQDTNFFPAPRVTPPPPREVSSYDVWDLQGRYAGLRNTTIVLGIKNLFDRDPPFTNQPFSAQVGYDPTYADPRGRMFYAKLTYAFK